MKKIHVIALFAIILVIPVSFASAQCTCAAGELTGLNVNKDGECSSDLYTGYQNHITIEILRAQLKTGTIQWSFLPENSAGNWIALPAGWSGTENIDHPSLSIAENGSYRCIFTESTTNCRDTSIVAINVAPQPNIYVTNDSSTCEGIWFSVHDNNNPTGDGNNYCWQFDGMNCQSSNPAFLFPTPGCSMGYSDVNIIVSNSAACFDEAHLTGICNPELLDVYNDLNGSDILCRGVKTSLLSVKRYSAISSPSTWQYQWRRNGKAINGATAVDYTPTVGGVYTCKVVSGTGCQKVTNPITISFFPAVNVQISAVTTEICNRDSALLQVNPGNAIQYEWYRNGISTGATGTDYYAKKQGNYRVLATSIEGCTKFSNVIHPYVFTTTIQASGNQNLCNGNSIMIEATYNSDAVSFQWLRYSNPVSGATGSQFFATKSGRYRVVAVSTENCTDTSNSIYLTSNCREPASDGTFSIQPNPASTYIELTFPDTMKNAFGALMITNTLGQVVLYKNISISSSHTERITFTQRIENGSYFVVVTSNEKNYRKKLLISE